MNDVRHEPAGRPAGGDAPPALDPRTRRRLFVALAAFVVVAVVAAVALSVVRHRREASERARLARAADQGPRVLVAEVTRPEGARTVTLPGDVRSLEQATIFAKVSGYVTDLLVDKGDRVRRGQVLARVSSPETDDQVRSAAAALGVRRRNAERARRLAPRGIVSQAELDQANADLRAADAELRRVRALQSYEVVRAPFDGVVTARYVDPGALVTATSTGAPIVDVADPARLKVVVYMGQDVVPFVRVGDPAVVALDQAPGVHVPARVARLSDALDPRTRAMLVELALDVPDAPVRLVPGLFVHADVKVAIPPLPLVPPDALVQRGDKLQLALVRDRKLHFVDVEPGQTDGRTMQIRRGVSAGDVVALSPPSDLGEGAPVQPVTPEQAREERARQQQGGAQRQARTPPR